MSKAVTLAQFLQLPDDVVEGSKISLSMSMGPGGETAYHKWVTTGEVGFGYNSHRGDKRNFTRVGQMCFAFVQLPDNNKHWLLVSVGRITELADHTWCPFEPEHKYDGYIGRLVIEVNDKKNDRGRYVYNLKKWINSAIVYEIKAKKDTGEAFPGYYNLNEKMNDLMFYITNTNSGKDWKDKLQAVKAIYCLNNHDEHKVYIGSAYSSNGCLLHRWEDYFETCHGGNVELKKLFKMHGNDKKYFLENFYFSILEIFPDSIDDDYVHKREEHWMDVFNSHDPKVGYNKN